MLGNTQREEDQVTGSLDDIPLNLRTMGNVEDANLQFRDRLGLS